MAHLRLEKFNVFCDEPEGSWLYEKILVQLAADNYSITANGTDTATITAEVHPGLTEVIFHHADTGEPITTVPVDPATHTATLQVTATTPGVVRIRAGEPTMTKLNEAVIIAQ
jgi:hypothetical protein